MSGKRKTQLEKRIELVDMELARLSAKQAALSKQRENLVRETPLDCQYCGKKSKVKDLTYIQDHYYVRPYSCTEGDYWMPSNEAEWDCPFCTRRNRCYTTITQYCKVESGPRPWVMALKRYFKNIVDEHRES